VLVLAVAACGGGGESAEEAWAGDVCTSIASWKTEVESIVTNASNALSQPGATRTDLEDAINSGLDATTTLVDELHASVPPDTPEGDEAKAKVDAFLDDVQSSDREVRTALAGVPQSATLPEVITELSGLATTLQQTIGSGRTLVTDLQQLGGELKDGFENADSCQELRES
jgi:hypothetical protein